MVAPFSGQDDGEFDLMESFSHPGPDAEQQLLQREFCEAVDHEILRLSENERAVLVLYHQEECSYEAIAEILHLPLGTVRTHLHRGRQRLSEAIKGRTRAREAVTR